MRRTGLFVSIFGFALLITLLAPAQVFADEEDKEVVERAKKRVQELLEQAEELEADGQEEKAEKVRKEASAVRKELAAWLARRAKERGEHGENWDANRVEEVLHGLEAGIEALRALGDERGVGRLKEWMQEVRQRAKRGGAPRKKKGKRHKTERQVVEEWIEVLGFAVHTLRGGDRHEAAERLEHAKHALELGLEGRRDDEAREIRKSAPNFEEQSKLLSLAAEILVDEGKKREAEFCMQLAKEFAERSKGRKRARKEGGEERERAAKRKKERRREIPESDIGRLRLAMKAYLEADREDGAHRIEQAVHWRELFAEGHRGPDAQQVRRASPTPKQLSRLVLGAAELWQRWGHVNEAEALIQLARKLDPAGARGAGK